MKAFEEEEIKINYISGSSSGSIIASLYSMGYNSDEIYNLFQKYSKKIKYIEIKNILKLIYGFFIKRKIIITGLNSGKIIEKTINSAAKNKKISNINEIKFPLLIPTVSVVDGKIYNFVSTTKRNRISFSDENVIINDAEIGRVVRASCSYPVIFEPCAFNNVKLIDGGIRENIPWKGLKQMGADKVLSITFEKELDGNCCKNIIDVVSNAMDILCHELSNYELDGTDYLLRIKTKNIGLLDNKKIADLYELGYNAIKNNIKQIKETINN